MSTVTVSTNVSHSGNLLTYSQAAKRLTISLRHFRREFIDSGKLSFVEVAPRSPRVQEDDIEAHIASNKKKHPENTGAHTACHATAAGK